MLNEAIEFVKKYKELNAAGIYAVSINGEMHIQVKTNVLKVLPGLIVNEIDCEELGYYYEISTNINGVKVLALPSRSELEEHFPTLAKEVLGDVGTGLDIDQ